MPGIRRSFLITSICKLVSLFSRVMRNAHSLPTARKPVRRATNIRRLVSGGSPRKRTVKDSPHILSLAFIHEMKRNPPIPRPLSNPSGQSPDQDQPGMADAFLTSLARQNLLVLTKAIKRMEQYWAGIAYVSTVLKQRAAGKCSFCLEACSREIDEGIQV